MRRVISDLTLQNGIPDHIGLAYDMWAPIADDGKIPDNSQSDWFSSLESIKISEDYEHVFKRWKQGFIDHQPAYMEIELRSRLLVGHGNPSPTDVGLTLHHTWGVPVIPGSALKGLLNHYIQIVFGPNPCDKHPFDSAHPEPDRRDYQGVKWNGTHIEHGPGKLHRAFFGAPEAESDAEMRREYPAFAGYIGASRGLVCFHDALYIPGSGDGNNPYAKDILTVHQKRYYDKAGKYLPNDYDNPNPVAFLTVRPKAKFFVAVTGPCAWAILALDLLSEALEGWGVGGKTSAGYGKFKVVMSHPETAEEREVGFKNREAFIALSNTKSQYLVGRIDGLIKNTEKAFADNPQIKAEWATRALERISEAKLYKKHKDKQWLKTLREWSDMGTS